MTDQQPALDYDPLSVPTRPAATVMLVRDAESSGVEVFMMRRTAAAVFAASQYVFPGGKVDDADHAINMEPWCDGRTDATSSGLLQVPAGGLSFWVAAIRECFEEAGVLLARPAAGSGVVSFGDPAVAARYSTYRDEMNAGRLDLGELCRREDLRLVTDAIGYVSHWVTPIGPPRDRREPLGAPERSTRPFPRGQPRDVPAHCGKPRVPRRSLECRRSARLGYLAHEVTATRAPQGEGERGRSGGGHPVPG